MRLGACWSLLGVIAMSPAICAHAQAKDPCVSGLQLGQRPGPYSFLVASGPQRGQLTCYVCETAEKPAVVVFARSVNEPLAKLVAACDEAIAAKAKAGVRGWVTVLGEKTIAIDELGKWAKQAGLKAMPVGVFDDAVGPPSYKLADEADLTVLLFVDHKVIANFAFRKGELDEAASKQVVDEVKRLGAKR